MMFPDEYIPHGIPLLYDGEEIELTAEDEEFATFYADVPLDGPQVYCITALVCYSSVVLVLLVLKLVCVSSEVPLKLMLDSLQCAQR
jgi:hypothetical protein